MALNRAHLYLLLGVFLLFGSAGAGVGQWGMEYTHSVWDTGDDFNASHDGHFRYSNLSDRGKHVVDRTIEQSEYGVDSEAKTAPEFSYTTDNTAIGHGAYVIQRGGHSYTIWTMQNGPTFTAPLFTLVGLFSFGVLGGVLTALGWRETEMDLARSQVFLLLGTPLLVGSVWGVYQVSGLVSVLVVPVLSASGLVGLLLCILAVLFR